MKHQGQTTSETMSMLSLEGCSMGFPFVVSGLLHPGRHADLRDDVIVPALGRQGLLPADLVPLELVLSTARLCPQRYDAAHAVPAAAGPVVDGQSLYISRRTRSAGRRPW